MPNEQKLDCFPEQGATELECLRRDCCWEEVQNPPSFDVPYCFYKNQTALPPPKAPSTEQCSNFKDVERIDCHPELGATEKRCASRGCCWVEPIGTKAELNTPTCFYPHNYGGYDFLNITETEFGLVAYYNRTFRSTFPRDVQVIKIIVKFETETRLHVKIVDTENDRWEPSYPLVPKVDKKVENTAYAFEMHEIGGFKVIRKSDKFVM